MYNRNSGRQESQLHLSGKGWYRANYICQAKGATLITDTVKQQLEGIPSSQDQKLLEASTVSFIPDTLNQGESIYKHVIINSIKILRIIFYLI